MLDSVYIGKRSLDAYRNLVPDSVLDQLIQHARRLRGARVLHINATPYGGGVSELLRSIVPLLNDLGLDADWKIIRGDDEFFMVTKAIHNGLQGAPGEFTEKQKNVFLGKSRYNANLLEGDYDFIFVHDPQPVALLPLHGKGKAHWVWRCHVDTSHPNPEHWGFISQFLDAYDAAVFTMAEFAPPDLPIAHVDVIPPGIDPISPKNCVMSEAMARQILAWIGVQHDLPLVTQVSRFDPWKDPLGVVAAYRIARKALPNLQLALVGSMAMDDPEGWAIYNEVVAESATDPQIHVHTNLTGVGNIEVNAFQRLSNVIVQFSRREGFGLVVSEALWKQTPVVAGNAGGIRLQMADGVGGVVVEDQEQLAEALVALVQDPNRQEALGRSGQERVRRHFMLPRLMLNEILLMQELSNREHKARSADWASHRDPVCGIALHDDQDLPTATVEAQTFHLCSLRCKQELLAHPERYRAA